MITCKEDLVNTYIENDKGVLRDVYVSLINCMNYFDKVYIPFDYQNSYILAVIDNFNVLQVVRNSNAVSNCKQLTLTDLLPTSYENTKVYSLDEDVIRKYAELCGVEASKKVIKRRVELNDQPNGVVKIEGINRVFYFTRDTDEKTLTTEQILAAWDLRFNQPKPPRTKVECVKCEFEYEWQAVKALECTGACFYTKNSDGEYVFVDGTPMVLSNKDNLYRRTEVEIDWRDAASEFIESSAHLDVSDDLGCAFHKSEAEDDKEYDKELIKMCHLVASLTPKP